MASNSGFNTNSLLYAGAAIGTTVAAVKYMRQKPNEIDPTYDFVNQSVEIDPVEHIRVATTIKNKPLVEYRLEEFRTLYDVLPLGLKVSGNGPCLGHRVNGKGPFVWITYSDVIEQTRFIGSGLLNRGVEAVNSTNVGIYSANRPEWTVSEYACYTYSMTVISLYDTYGQDSIKYILNQAEISALFVDCYRRLVNVLNVISELPYLRYIIHYDELTAAQKAEINVPSNVELISFNDLMRDGRNNLRSPVPPKPSDTATICYTSGTTGAPKGAIITHGNIVCQEACGHLRRHRPHLKAPGCDGLNPVPVHYSFLPLAHMIERTGLTVLLARGGRVGFNSGDLLKLMGILDDYLFLAANRLFVLEECQLLKPTNIAFVPRVLNKVYDKVKGEIGNNKVKMFLLNKAVAAKEADRLKGIIRRDTIYDKIIFKKIRDLFGGQVERTGTGSAPISNEVLAFARAAFGCPIPESYGQTEATLCITSPHALDPETGHVGPPYDCFMVKLVDIPEMDYYAKDNKGEICCKGPSVFKGYFKQPDKTAEAIDKDGWLHTGDVGMWLPNGCLKLIDRKKHIFKLSQGEYISPEKVEAAYCRCRFISQMFADGDSLQDSVVAVVVPNEENLMAYAKANNIPGTFKELCKREDIRKLIMNEVNETNRSCNLASFEKVKNIHLHDEPFSLENNLLTITMKLKRAELRKHFKQVFEHLYKELNTVKSKL